jgi:4a-hydroxytetrahydrobiopterin dehydratase
MAWQEQNNALERTWMFPDFSTAWDFARRCAQVFEQQGHHADLLVGWGKVTVTTTTHDAGNRVTEKDHALAKALDALHG